MLENVYKIENKFNKLITSLDNQLKIILLENYINKFLQKEFIFDSDIKLLNFVINAILQTLDVYELNEDFSDGQSFESDYIIIIQNQICIENSVSYISLFEALDFIYTSCDTKFNTTLINQLFDYIKKYKSNFEKDYSLYNQLTEFIEKIKLSVYKVE